LPGDVVTHSWDSGNGANFPPSHLVWTSPASGELDLAGNVWLARHIGRDVAFSVFINGILQAALGDASLADTSRASRHAFALDDVAVSAGDTIRLQFDTLSLAGEFVGVNLSLDLTPRIPPRPPEPVPSPPTLPLVLAALTILWLGQRQNSQYAPSSRPSVSFVPL
jgi:hypothetical protein